MRVFPSFLNKLDTETIEIIHNKWNVNVIVHIEAIIISVKRYGRLSRLRLSLEIRRIRMPSSDLDQLLFTVNPIEESQLHKGYNNNYMNLDLITDVIPEIPTWNFFKNGNIAVTKNNRFSYVPAHTHSFIEFNYMYSGHCTQYINNQRIELRQGDLLLMDKDIVQRVDYTDFDDIFINILIESEAYLSNLFTLIPESLNIITRLIYNADNSNSIHNNFILFDLSDNQIATNLVESLIQKGLVLPTDQPESNQSMALILSALIIELKTTIKQSMINFTDSDADSTLPIISYINNHYTDATLTTVSKRFGYNRNYLSDKLKATTGKTFQELINLRRLSVAENLIIKTNYSNADISELIGYKNETSLFRLFNHYLAISPTRYRNKIHTSNSFRHH